MKRVRIKDVRSFRSGLGFSIRAGPYWKGLPLATIWGRTYTYKWVQRQPWADEFFELVSRGMTTADDLRELLVDKYVNVYSVEERIEIAGPYKGRVFYHID